MSYDDPYSNKSINSQIMNESISTKILQGYLEKQSPSFFAGYGWQKRYFVLVDKRLKYFNDEEDVSQALGYLNFDAYRCKVFTI